MSTHHALSDRAWTKTELEVGGSSAWPQNWAYSQTCWKRAVTGSCVNRWAWSITKENITAYRCIYVHILMFYWPHNVMYGQWKVHDYTIMKLDTTKHISAQGDLAICKVVALVSHGCTLLNITTQRCLPFTPRRIVHFAINALCTTKRIFSFIRLTHRFT